MLGRRDKGVGPPFGRAEPDQDVFDLATRSLECIEAARLRPGRGAARDVGIAIGSGDLFDDVVDPVRGATHIGPIGRHHDRQGVGVLINAAEPNRFDQRGDGLFGERHADLALDPGNGQVDGEGLGDVPVDPESTVGDQKVGHGEGHQLAEALYRRLNGAGVRPRSKRAEASVRTPRRLEVRAITIGVK